MSPERDRKRVGVISCARCRAERPVPPSMQVLLVQLGDEAPFVCSTCAADGKESGREA